MPKIRPEFTTTFYEPKKKEPCVCGSGLRFKRCCYGVYSSKGLNEFRDFFNIGNYKEALVRIRRHFTWYALVHKAHTVPLIKNDAERWDKNLQLDIDALSELLDNIGLCYYSLGIGESFIEVLDSSALLIEDKRWTEKISYAKGVWYLVENNDELSAYNCIEKINISDCSNPEILSLYLQVKPTKLTYKESASIIEKIVARSKSESVKLQYRILMGINLLLIFETKDAIREMINAIEKYKNLESEKKSTYGNLLYAQALELLGKISNNTDCLHHCKEVVLSLIKSAHIANYKSGHIYDLHKLLGDVEAGLSNHNAAIDAYRKCPSDINNIFLAKSLCNANDLLEARSVLQSINNDILDINGKLDLAIAWTTLALQSLENSDLVIAKKHLKSARTEQPYFKHLRDELLIEIYEAKPKLEDSGKIKKFIRKLNSYVTLNPNIFGLGININKIIEDADSEISKNGQLSEAPHDKPT